MNMSTRVLNHSVTTRSTPCDAGAPPERRRIIGGRHEGPRGAPNRTPEARQLSDVEPVGYLSPPLPSSPPPMES